MISGVPKPCCFEHKAVLRSTFFACEGRPDGSPKSIRPYNVRPIYLQNTLFAPRVGTTNHQSGPGSNALRVRGFSILPFKEHVKRVSRRHDNPDSRIEAMEAVVTSVKGAYYPHQINVAAWDVGLGMEEPECYGMVESGTAKNPEGLAYRYAVFRGQGVIKWKGEL